LKKGKRKEKDTPFGSNKWSKEREKSMTDLVSDLSMERDLFLLYT